MIVVISSIIGLFFLMVIGTAAYWHTCAVIVAEDHMAVTTNKDGFIKRVLPAGRHLLRLFERIDFILETKVKLASGRATDIATSDGVQLKIDWSGTYALRPEQITGSRSQRLRSLPYAERAIARTVDLALRKFAGGLTVAALFSPTARERLERQLSQVITDKLQPLGIVFNGLNLQAIQLPQEVAEALNKARAIETLDGAIRHLDPTTREVVRGVYQLDEILHWDQYLPVPTRHTMTRLAQAPAN